MLDMLPGQQEHGSIHHPALERATPLISQHLPSSSGTPQSPGSSSESCAACETLAAGGPPDCVSGSRYARGLASQSRQRRARHRTAGHHADRVADLGYQDDLPTSAKPDPTSRGGRSPRSCSGLGFALSRAPARRIWWTRGEVIIRVSRQPGIRYVARCCGAGWHLRARPLARVHPNALVDPTVAANTAMDICSIRAVHQILASGSRQRGL